MTMLQKIASDALRVAPLATAAWYVEFVSKYGALTITVLSVIYGVLSVVLRCKELYDKFKEKRRVSREGKHS